MEYRIVVKKSKELTNTEINHFCFVCSEVFGINMHDDYFVRKYIDNPYGDSVVCLAYDSLGNPVAARAFWRNDIDGVEAYQPCDTGVLSNHRKQGLFETMTKKALEFLSPNSFIYNFPNNNSRRLYIKLGWKTYGEYRPRFWKNYQAYHNEHPEMMSKLYFDWWAEREKQKFEYIKMQHKYFLVRRYGRFFYIVVAEIDNEIVQQINKARLRPLLYWSVKRTFYNRNREIFYVLYNSTLTHKIPIWKIDAL